MNTMKTKLICLLTLLFTLTTATLCAQSYEHPASVRINNYTNETYYHKDGS